MRYMLFGGDDTYERLGGMHDFMGLYDTIEEAIAAAAARGCEWYHVADRETFEIVVDG